MFASAGAIVNFDNDSFGYSEFVRTIAKGLVNRSNITEPYVVGIDAAWGMGKTSAANLIVKAFEEIGCEDPSDTHRVHVVHFSPWLASGFEALAISYIAELTGALNKSFGHRLGSDWKMFQKRLLKRFGRLASVSTGSAANYFAPGIGALVTNTMKAMFEVSETSTEALGAELRQKLAKVDAGQIVVIVDDVDRLHPDEMRHLLSLVTTFGNLPRVAHIILHDKKIVDEAMKKTLLHGSNGGPTYLEKIVQLPVALPAIDPVHLRDFLIARIKKCCSQLEFEKYENDLRELWRDYLRQILTTPRDVTRLTNSLAATWPSISDYAELTDFIGIEALRLVQSEIWEKIRDQRYALVQGLATSEKLGGKEALGPVNELIQRLFPLVAPSSETIRYKPVTNRRAISSADSVDVYFRFQKGGIAGRSFLNNMLEGANIDKFSQRLGNIADYDQLRSILNDLNDRLNEQLPLSPADIFQSICTVGDRLITWPKADPPSFYDLKIVSDLDELSWAVLKLIAPEERQEVVRKTIQESASITFPALVWWRLYHREEELIGRKGIEQLGNTLVYKFKYRLDLKNAPMLSLPLQAWALTNEIDELDKTVSNLVHNDIGLVNILDGLMGQVVSCQSAKTVSYRSLGNREGVSGFNCSQLQSLASDALQRFDFPLGITDPEQVTIAKKVLEAYIRAMEEERRKGSFSEDVGRSIIIEELKKSGWMLNFNTKISHGSKPISFLQDGTIGDGQNRNEHSWSLVGDILEIKRNNGKLQNRFTYDGDREQFVSTDNHEAEAVQRGYIGQTIYRKVGA